MGFTGFSLEDSLQIFHFREESHFRGSGLEDSLKIFHFREEMGFTGFSLEDSLQIIHFREESHTNKSLSTETHRYTDPPDLWIYLEKLLGAF